MYTYIAISHVPIGYTHYIVDVSLNYISGINECLST